MDKSELELALSYFENACARFKEALSHDPKTNDLYLDATIQRFEFSFETCWKTLKRFLKHEAVDTKSPRDAFKEAFRLGWLPEGDAFWSKMIEDRNLTSHTYDQKIAQDLYPRLKTYYSAYDRLLAFLRKK